MKTIFTIILAFALASCAKENIKQRPSEIQNHQILGKWNYVSEVSSWTYQGCVYTNIDIGKPSDTWTFQPDKKLVKHTQKDNKTVHYDVKGSDKIVLEGWEMEITKLQEGKIKLYYYNATEGNGTSIGNIYLKK